MTLSLAAAAIAAAAAVTTAAVSRRRHQLRPGDPAARAGAATLPPELVDLVAQLDPRLDQARRGEGGCQLCGCPCRYPVCECVACCPCPGCADGCVGSAR